MKILVIDDSKEQRDAAVKALAQHDLTIVDTVREARELLTPQIDKEKYRQLLDAAGFPENFNQWREGLSEETRKRFFQEERKAEINATILPNFDVVLTDLMMPGEQDGQGDAGLRFIGKMIPYGFGIAALALKNGVKKVAIVSLENHHSHPIVWLCDAINGTIVPGFKIFTQNTSMGRKDLPDVEEPWKIKNWTKALDDLLK